MHKYKDNIILWNKNLDLNSVYVAQNIRIYYPSILKLPENEIVMLTDMDMLPANDIYYKHDIDKFNIDDFIYYRNIDFENKQIYMCYNAAHPKIWGKVFNIYNEEDIEKQIIENNNLLFNGNPGSNGWFIDQEIMYNKLINYKYLNILNRPIKRLEVYMYHKHLNNNDTNFIKNYDDIYFHRSYLNNEQIILNAEIQMNTFTFT